MNLGCKVNRVESDHFARILSSYEGSAPTAVDADIVVINTCTVTSVAEKKTRKCVRRALSDHPHAIVIVTGCAATQSSVTYEQMSNRVKVADRIDVGECIERELSALGHNLGPRLEPMAALEADPVTNEASPAKDLQPMAHRSRMGVKIQDGCDNECSYCIVHELRGKERSTPHRLVIEECKELSNAGIPEIMLTGINTGRYSSDGLSLRGLSEALLSLSLPSRLRISSVEPVDFDVAIAELAEDSNGMLCRHFHIPIQSGCAKVLGLMNRDYDDAFIHELVRGIRSSSPCASISTDVIVGFPGESEADFEETLALCQELGFSKIHVFPYSQREGTPAAEMPAQIDPQTKRQRARALQRLASKMRAADLEARKGSTELVAVESEQDSLTESYHWIGTPLGASPMSLVAAKL